LISFAQPDPVHVRLAKVLHEIGYTGNVAIEMRAQPDGLASVRQAVAAVSDIYRKF